MNLSRAMIFGTSLVLGVLVVTQFRSYTGAQELVDREIANTNLFAEIQTLKRISEDLEQEARTLEQQSQESLDATQATATIQADIEKYEILAGFTDVSGTGIVLTVSDKIPIFWLVDLVNDLWSGGAEAIAINTIRITSSTWGLTAVGGHVLLNGTTLDVPLTISVIGNAETLNALLDQKTGFLERFKATFPETNITIDKKDDITIPKIR